MNAQDIRDDQWTDADHSGETDDEWHRHSSAEGAPQHAHGQTTPAMIALVGLGSFIALSATIFVVDVFFHQANRAEHVLKIEDYNFGEEITTQKASWEAALKTYGWVDAQKNLIHVPLDLAMNAVIKDYTSAAK